MRNSLKHTYRKLLRNNPNKARKKKLSILYSCKNFLEENKKLNRQPQIILKKEGR